MNVIFKFDMGGNNSKPRDPPHPSFQAIPDQYETYEQLQQALRAAGLESSNLIVGIDYTKSNTWTGTKTFGGRSLHDIDQTGQSWNPYQSVIHIIGRTLEAFDDDKMIPVFGFGDATTGGYACFPFLPSGEVCVGFEQVLARYNQITPQMALSGPTNFAPVIREAIRIVQQQRSYHILVIIADGQVTNEKDTIQAIVEASSYPLSIIMVGVGDGPWDMMKKFDDQLPSRRFDNFQFVDYTKCLQQNVKFPEVGFATSALMEIPDQYKTLRKLGLLNIRPSPPSTTFRCIPDQYETYEQLQLALRSAGLESSNLIVAIDYTKSNTWTGQNSFQGKCLHEIDPSGQMWNPYQSVIHILGRTLETFDDDKLIPAFGFGDATTGGRSCFPFLPDGELCQGFDHVLA
ncbi:hypothetical protein THRCLA_06494, partial [Thraustotheca clavata]